MQNVQLGRSGIVVSRIILGAGSIGGIGSPPATRGLGLSAAQGLEQLDEAYRRGVRVVDTADEYGGGESERVVGEWRRGRPAEDVLIISKTGIALHGDERRPDLSPARVTRRIDRSIERIGRVDLHLAHVFDPGTPIRQWLEVFAEAQRDRKIRGYGVCNVTAAQLEDVLATADAAGLPRPVVVQSGFSLLRRADERDLLPLLASEGIGYTPVSTLAGGVLSDRYLDGAPVPPDSRIGVAGDLLYTGAYTPENLRRVARLREVSAEAGISVAGLALAWVLAHPAVTAPIVAPSRPAQWIAVEEALRTPLPAETVSRVTELFS